MHPDLASAFLRWALFRAALARGWWLAGLSRRGEGSMSDKTYARAVHSIRITRKRLARRLPNGIVTGVEVSAFYVGVSQSTGKVFDESF